MTKAYKILFLTMIFMSTSISISSYSWLGMWMGLEMNLLSIIPLLQNNKNMISTESAIKYFIVQAIASTIILMSIIMMMNKSNLLSNMNLQSMFILSMNSALLTKMGMAPFHFWFPEMMEGLNWLNSLLILTWQKIAPMILLMYNMKFIMFMSIIIMTSMVISGLMGINQISMRKILAYSSINHMGWMISTMMIMETIWTLYFLIYSIITLNIILILKYFKVYYLKQLYQTMNANMMIKMFFIMNFLSLSGIPPFLGFMPKWLTIQTLMYNNMLLLPTIMIMLTLMTIYVYMRITLSTLLMNINEMNWKQFLMKNKFKSFYMSTMNFMSISSLIIVTMMFNMT